MTCIVGWTDGTRVTLGGDAAAVGGMNIILRASAKVFANGPMVMGFTTSFRMGDLLEHALRVPRRPKNESVDRYMRTRFIDAVRKTLADGGWKKSESGRDEGGTFLVGYEGRLFQVEDDFQVGEALAPYDAVGCGAKYALGALHAVHGAREIHAREAKQALRVALEAAAALSAGVRAPFTFVEGGRRSRRSG